MVINYERMNFCFEDAKNFCFEDEILQNSFYSNLCKSQFLTSKVVHPFLLHCNFGRFGITTFNISRISNIGMLPIAIDPFSLHVN